MADLSERLDAMFPKLTRAQIDRLRPVGRPRQFAPGELIYERGSAKRAFYVLLEGRVEIASPAREGEERITILAAGEFTGEVDMMSGRQSLVGGEIVLGRGCGRGPAGSVSQQFVQQLGVLGAEWIGERDGRGHLDHFATAGR